MTGMFLTMKGTSLWACSWHDSQESCVGPEKENTWDPSQAPRAVRPHGYDRQATEDPRRQSDPHGKLGQNFDLTDKAEKNPVIFLQQGGENIKKSIYSDISWPKYSSPLRRLIASYQVLGNHLFTYLIFRQGKHKTQELWILAQIFYKTSWGYLCWRSTRACHWSESRPYFYCQHSLSSNHDLPKQWWTYQKLWPTRIWWWWFFPACCLTIWFLWKLGHLW